MQILDSGVRGSWDGKRHDGTIVEGDKGCFFLRWGKKGVGFGEVVFVFKKDGTVNCDNECMSKEFIKEVLEAFLKEAVLINN